ncbi:MAG: NifB/NifX family molybdenum-iron cluster-binding protein [Nanoarchaeota archaeon]|nr:NifB/NifX family molybdenum-iron cluster-binding protein [Nanoarchaeota archaeon]
MKIVIPTNDKKGLDAEVAEHFGRCQTYTFLDENGELIEIVDNASRHMGGVGLPPEVMKRHGANVLLCKNLGPNAIMLCNQLGIEVYTNNSETVRDIFNLWKNKHIKKAEIGDGCKDHKH